jgi:hypothetical protein
MEHTLKKRNFLQPRFLLTGLAVLLVISAAIGGGYYYWTGTPQYTLEQLRTAYQTHDVDLALKYIDTDAVFDTLWTQIEAQMVTQASQSTDSWSTIGTMIGQGMVEGMKPALKEKFETGLTDAIKTGTTTSQVQDAVQKGKIVRSGDEYIVDTGTAIKLDLKKEDGQHYWRVVAIEGIYDPSSTDATTTTP